MSNALDLATVEMTRFEPLMNEIFLVRAWEGSAEDSPFELELVRILAHPTARQEGKRLPFSRFFNGPAGVALQQGTYDLDHSQTGKVPLFLVPVGRKEDRTQLQAVIN